MYQALNGVSRRWRKRYFHTIFLLLIVTSINHLATLLPVPSYYVNAIGVGNGRSRANTSNTQQKSIPTTSSLMDRTSLPEVNMPANDTVGWQNFVKSFRLKPAPETMHYPYPCEFLSTPQTMDNAPVSWNCTAGSFCLFSNHKEACPAGFFCPENTAQPLYCCGGYYCPTPDKIKICPEGKFCPHGSTEPQGCHFLAKCPEGTATVSKFGVIFLFGAFMTVASMLFAIKQRKDNIKRIKYQHLLQYGYGAQDESANVDMGQVERTFDISFTDLGLVLPSGVEIMRGVSGELKSSRCCAILGPSGAGKTTFVSLLTGKAQRTSGSVQINGVDEPLSNYSKLIGFVPQEDIMLRELTVRDILMHSAMMRLPAKLPQRAKKKKVLETIKYLELGHVMDNVIGDEATRGISGGQRKRVNIGMELVANPSVLFLDEPTSGLDSATSYEVCSLLRNIAHKQRLTVAAVIHSPSPQAFNQFDDLLVLGKGGRVVYFGPRDKALDYFHRIGFTCPPDENPADFYIAVTSGKVRPQKNPNYRPSDLFLYWERYTLYEDSCTPPNSATSRLMMMDGGRPTSTTLMTEPYSFMDDHPGGVSNYHYDNDSEMQMSSINASTACKNVTRFLRDVGVAVRTIIHDWTSYLSDLAREFYCFMACVLQFWRNDPIRSTPNVLVVFLLCFKRACMQIYRSRDQFLKDQLLHLGCGAFISIAARQSDYLGRQPESICQIAPIALQFMCREPFDHIAEVGVFVSLGVLFSGINVGSSTFGNEKVVYWRDSAAGMRTIPYFLAKMVADLPRCLIAALCFSLSFIVFFPYRSKYIYLYCIISLLYYVAFAMGYFISIITNKEMSGLVGTAFALAWAIVFSGSVPDLSDVMHDDSYLPSRWLWRISAPRYAIEAIFIKEVGARPFPEIREDRLPHEYNLNNYTYCLFAVAIIGIVWNVIALIFMKLVNRTKIR
ncbi:hypothetical protein BDF22DRAFT_743185 [Syncephalis plumigaleata]|nr:hypothetical protein BDF22DRAFT_743185 [Syncephalis plumigaleata]